MDDEEIRKMEKTLKAARRIDHIILGVLAGVPAAAVLLALFQIISPAFGILGLIGLLTFLVFFARS